MRRKSIRLPEYDYTEPGGYFITIVTHRQYPLFGEIENGIMRLNDYGRIVDDEWRRSAMIRAPWEFNHYLVMPNHFHGIVEIKKYHEIYPVGAHSGAPLRRLYRPPNSLGSFIAGFKSACTTRINILRGVHGQPVWQRNYYEHVIRDDTDRVKIAAYIAANPWNWDEDHFAYP